MRELVLVARPDDACPRHCENDLNDLVDLKRALVAILVAAQRFVALGEPVLLHSEAGDRSFDTFLTRIVVTTSLPLTTVSGAVISTLASPRTGATSLRGASCAGGGGEADTEGDRQNQ